MTNHASDPDRGWCVPHGVVMGIFDRIRGESVRVHILISGPIGDGWREVDTHLRVPRGTTLGRLVQVAERAGVPLRDALEHSPDLTDTMTLNGERCPFLTNSERELADGDQLSLVAQQAGS